MPTNAPVPLTPEELERLEELCQNATPGPFVVEEVAAAQVFIVQPDEKGGWYPIAEMSSDGDFQTAELFAAARTALPALLHEVRQSWQGWIPVSEKLPEVVGDYLVICQDDDCRVAGLAGWHYVAEYFPDDIGTIETGWHDFDGRLFSEYFVRVTHWRPLPAAPSTEETKGTK